MNELNTTAESTPIVLKTVIPINSLTPSPEIPTGNANNINIDNRANTKNTSIIFVCCPNDKNSKKNNNDSKKLFTSVISELYNK